MDKFDDKERYWEVKLNTNGIISITMVHGAWKQMKSFLDLQLPEDVKYSYKPLLYEQARAKMDVGIMAFVADEEA